MDGAQESSAQPVARAALQRVHEGLFPGRFRQITILGMLIIASFYPMDLLYPWPAYVDLSRLDFLVLRGLWIAGYGVMLLSAPLGERSPRLQVLRGYALMVHTALFLGVLCAGTGRLCSPYYVGVILLVLARCVILPGAVARAAQMCLVMVATWLVVTLLWPAKQASPGLLAGEAMTHLLFVFESLVLGLLGARLSDRLALRLEAAKLLGRYRIGARIGAGGIGEVYEAHHAALRRRCAVKLLKPEFCDREAVARFVREAEAASRLNHPNSIAVFDVGYTDSGRPYYVMEHLVGCDLRTLVKQGGALLPERAVYLLLQAARSLGEAHRHGLIHRDVKPANLFITSLGGQSDFVKVLDFGMVKGVDLGPALTRAGTVMGTPRYIAPELYEGGPVSPRVDVYGLGIVAYYMLCGRPPFYSGDAQRDVRRQVREAPPSVGSLRDPRLPSPSEELLEIIALCVERAPERRPADAAVLAVLLESTPEYGRWHPPMDPAAAVPPPELPPRLSGPDEAELLGLVWERGA